MASITKHGFLFVLVGLTCALIASAEAREAWSVERQAPPERSAQASGASAIRNPQSAISLSVPFIQNQGQIADPQVLFYARTFGGTVFVTTEGQIIYALPQSAIRNPQSAILLIRETLVDADLTALPSGAERSGAMINSFIGNDPRRWQANIPAFTGVQFGDIYEGISLEVRATGNNVEKIFTVAPGADPARIALRLAGTEGVSITSAGELEARTTLGPVRFTAPVAYQRGTAGERQGVSVAYALEGDQVGFCVGAFDAARPLVIDPLLASTFIGGTNGDNVIRAMVLDNQTNVLMAGYTAATDFPTNNCSDYKGVPPDGFIAKFDPQLTNLLAATYIGGVGEDAIMAMGINTNNGDVYVAGYTASTDFPMQDPLYGTYRGGAYDAFVSVLDSNLTALTASTYLGGTNVDMAYALALNAAGDVYVAGYTASTNFPTNNTYGATFQNTCQGSNDAFVTKFNAALSANQASTYIGGSSNDQAFSMAVDTNDFIYLAGVTASTNFPAFNGYTNILRGLNDAFVTKLSGALTNVAASTFLGGTSNEAANGIAVAPFTNIVCVVGYTYSANFPQNPTSNSIAPGYTNQSMGGKDAFLTRLDLGLTNILASTYIGGTGDDEARAVLAYAHGVTNYSLRIYVAGDTTSSNFPVTANAYNTNANGGLDAFVSYFSTGDTLRASTYLGGATNDTAYAVALQADRYALFVAGKTASTNFPATLRAYDNDRTGQTNDYGFVTKLGAGLAYGTEKWQVTLRDFGDETAMAGSPSLGWGGTVYCGFGSNLVAFDAFGNQRWRVRMSGRLVDPANPGAELYGKGCIPAVGTNGTIYITTDVGDLQAVNPTDGSVKWTWSPPGVDPAYYSSPAIDSNGVIYFGTSGNNLYAVRDDGDSGVTLWTNILSAAIETDPAITTDGRIVVASEDQLYMYQTNGTLQTNWSLPDLTYSSPTIGSNGWIYIGNGSKLYAFDPGSSATQHTWTAAGPIFASPTIGPNGLIYVGGGTNFYAFNPDGTTSRVWGLGGIMKSSATVDTNGNVIVGAGSASGNYYLYSFDTNSGAVNWDFNLSMEVDYHSPLIQRDGTIYMTDQYNIYSIFGPAATPRTNWPTARHDVLRTGNAAFDAAQILKPAGLTASPQGTNLEVSWTGDPNADYYEVFRGTTNDPGTNSLIKTDLLTTTYVDTNIERGKIYYYWVRVATPVALSVFSDSSAGGVPPSPPTDVNASKGNPTNSITVTWSNSVNATMYYVYSNAVNSTDNVGLAWTTNGNTYADTNITRGLTNYYWVKAGNGAAGISGFSTNDYGGTPPLPPTSILAGQGVSSQAVDVVWSASLGASMYAVYRNTSTNIPAGFMAVTNGTSYSDADTMPFQTNYYWVRSTNEFGLGEFSALAAGYRRMGPPRSIWASYGTFASKIRVSWSDPESIATAYLIYRNTNSDSVAESDFLAEIARPDSSVTNYDDSTITRGAGYYYWIKSKNDAGPSDFSGASDIGGTAPYPPLNVSATTGGVQVTVTWTAANYATGYEVYRTNIYTLTPPLLDFASGTNYDDTTASPGIIYYYWIKATNQFGRSSEWSWFDTGWRLLTTPTNLIASDGEFAECVKVNWSSDNASTYELWRGTNNDLNAAQMLVNACTTTNYDDTDATPGVLFYYWVRAKTLNFIGEFSDYDSGWRALGDVDIGVSDLVFLPTRMVVGGTPAAVSFRVTNYGMQNMAASNDTCWVACNFYISSNSAPGGWDYQLMGVTTQSVPLAAGNSTNMVLPKAVRNSIAVPTGRAGANYIYVNIRHAAPSKWCDPNLGNNTTNRNGGVIQVGATQPAGLLLVNDYNGDGLTDLAMYREADGDWQIWLIGFGGVTDWIEMTGRGGPDFQAVPSDYDGDGKTDPAVYQAATGTWVIWLSASDYALVSFSEWGGPKFKPVPGDYDGDGLADPAVYQEATPSTSPGQGGTWYIWLSGSGYSRESLQDKGGKRFQPVPRDYDGDGKTDPAVYQEAMGKWKIWRSASAYALVEFSGWGGPKFKPVPSDYDGDGHVDPAVFQAGTGMWRIWLSASGYAVRGYQDLGNIATVAVPGDFDGDGLTDPAVYWDTYGMWCLLRSSLGYTNQDILVWPGGPGVGFRPVWR